MDNFPPLNSQNNNSTPGGRNVPPPPPPPIAIRTMGSDVKSMEQAGGGSPVPQRFDLNQQPLAAKPMPMPEAPTEVKINIPGYEGPEEKLFTPETIVETKNGAGEKKSHSHTILFVVFFVLIAGGLGAAGYFLYPVFFPASVAPITTPPATVTPPPATTSPVAILKHNSYITSDSATTPVLSLAQAKDVAPTMASGTKPVLKEIVLQDASGSQPNFSKYFSSLVNVFSESDLRAIFDDDFTTFIYYTQQGSWPGYVAKLKDGASLAIAQNIIRSKMESFPLIANLFLSNPGGSLAAGYKDGNLNGRPSRYLSFSEKDAAINYAFIDNYFLISTNYAAATEAAKRLIMSTSTSAVSPNF